MLDTKLFREADHRLVGHQPDDIVSAVKNCELNKIYTDDFTNVTRVALAIAKSISKTFENDSRFRHLVFTPILSGSMTEETKCFMPDEVDIVCRLENIVYDFDVDDHRVKCRAAHVVEFQHLCDSDADIVPSKLNRDFFNAVDIVIQEGRVYLPTNNEKFSITMGTFALHFEDKISRLVVGYNSHYFNDLEISIDLAPAGYRPDIPLPLNVECHEHYALAKVSRFDDENINFSVSYSLGEQTLMASLPEHMRDGYILAKAIRLTAICEQPGLSREDLQDLEPIDIQKYISSYTLKNCLFIILKNIKKGQMGGIESCRFAWADATYGELIDQLETKRCIDVWYDESGTLLNCTNHDEDIYSCCQKRRLILALCYQIRFWLTENLTKLKCNEPL